MNSKFLKISLWVTVIALICLFAIIFKETHWFKNDSNDDELLSSIRADFKQKITSNFSFINQYNTIIDQNTFTNKIYIADFFFTSCPTICPLMGGNKVRIQNEFESNEDVMLLSHSIDTKNDTVPRLLEYAIHMGAIKDKWHLVTGKREDIYDIAKEYYVTAQESQISSGSYVHDGSFILIDKKRQIRGIYDGTNPKDTDLLIADINTLLEE